MEMEKAESNEIPSTSRDVVQGSGSFNVDWSNQIAKGTGSGVYHCQHNGTTGKYAAKVMDKQLYKGHAEELKILQAYEEKSYLLRYITHWTSGDRLIIITDLCGMDVMQCIKECKKGFDLEICLTPMDIAKNMIEGIFQLHQLGIVHRDIKPSNFLLKKCDGRTVVKVCDFGLSRTHSTDYLTTARGTLEFMAPKDLRAMKNNTKVEPNFKSDVFSLGLVLFYVLSHGDHPFDFEDYKIRMNENPSFQKLWQSELSQEEKVNSSALISWMLQHVEDLRPSIEDTKCHPLTWSCKEKIDFFQEVVKRFEKAPTGKQPSVVMQENESFFFESDCSIEEKREKLDFYPAWMLDCSMGRNETQTFNITNETVAEFLADLGRKNKKGELFDRCCSVVNLLKLIRNKIQHANAYPVAIREKYGLGENKDWKKYYKYFTRNNPQLLLRVYQVFGNDKELQDFKMEMFKQDRGPSAMQVSFTSPEPVSTGSTREVSAISDKFNQGQPSLEELETETESNLPLMIENYSKFLQAHDYEKAGETSWKVSRAVEGHGKTAEELRINAEKSREEGKLLNSILLYDVSFKLFADQNNRQGAIGVRDCVWGLSQASDALLKTSDPIRKPQNDKIVRDHVIPLMQKMWTKIQTMTHVKENFACLQQVLCLFYIEYSLGLVGDYSSRETTLKLALSMMEKQFGDDTGKYQVYGTLLNRLGDVYEKTNRLEESVDYYMKAESSYQMATDVTEEKREEWIEWSKNNLQEVHAKLNQLTLQH